MQKKQEIILFQDIVSLDEFKNLIKKNIFPLCICLKEEEIAIFKQNNKISDNDLINKLYSTIHFKYYLPLNGYELRRSIENSEIYVNKFLDHSKKIKNIRFIAPSFGYDLDYPKVVFKKTPRLFFKTSDHFSLDAKYEGEEIIRLWTDLIEDDLDQKQLAKKIIK